LRYLLFLLLTPLFGCSHTVDDQSKHNHNEQAVSSERVRGIEFATNYKERIIELNNEVIKWNYNIEVDMEVLKKHMATYYASGIVFGSTTTESDKKDKVYEWALLSKYAKEKDIYPSDEEIEGYKHEASLASMKIMKEEGLTNEEMDMFIDQIKNK
jgi:hypothetical protein